MSIYWIHGFRGYAERFFGEIPGDSGGSETTKLHVAVYTKSYS